MSTNRPVPGLRDPAGGRMMAATGRSFDRAHRSWIPVVAAIVALLAARTLSMRAAPPPSDPFDDL